MKLLPEILIEYLWNLAEQETRDVDGALVECSLTFIQIIVQYFNVGTFHTQ